MIAYKYPYENSKQQDSPLVVVPSSAKYAEQMVDLMAAAYGCPPEETYTPEQFRTQIRVFPEGQFIALDTRTDRVVGLTISMRVNFDPQHALLESWVETTNYG